MLEDCYFRVWLLVFLPFFFPLMHAVCIIVSCFCLFKMYWDKNCIPWNAQTWNMCFDILLIPWMSPDGVLCSWLEKLHPSSSQDWRPLFLSCIKTVCFFPACCWTSHNPKFNIHMALICIWFLSVNLTSVRAVHTIHSSVSEFSISFFQWVISHGNLQT